VVVDHVEDHLDAGAVQRLDHVAEFVEHLQRRAARHGVAGVRGEEGQRRVAPVIAASGRGVLGVEGEHRHQLDGGDAQLLQVGDLVDQAPEAAAPFVRHAAALVHGEAAHVQFVDDGLREGPVQRPVALPVVAAVVGHHHRAQRLCQVAAPRLARRFARVGGRLRDGAGVGVEQQLAGVEAQAMGQVLGAVRPVELPAVALTGLDAGKQHMPIVPGAVLPWVQLDARRRLRRVGAVEQQQGGGACVLGVDAEVDAGRFGLGAQRVGASGQHQHVYSPSRSSQRP
jgi:hypothetical protein